jgi:hypothetical protein
MGSEAGGAAGRGRSSSREGERRKTHLPGDKFAERERAAQPRASSCAVPTRSRDQPRVGRHTSRPRAEGGLRNPPHRWISRPTPHAPGAPATADPRSVTKRTQLRLPSVPCRPPTTRPTTSAATRHRGDLPRALEVVTRRGTGGSEAGTAPERPRSSSREGWHLSPPVGGARPATGNDRWSRPANACPRTTHAEGRWPSICGHRQRGRGIRLKPSPTARRAPPTATGSPSQTRGAAADRRKRPATAGRTLTPTAAPATSPTADPAPPRARGRARR